MQKADEWEPTLPGPLANGNYPALEYSRASLALKFIRQRRRLGLTQADLAQRAGVRLESVRQLEQGMRLPSAATVEKIDWALNAVEAEGNGTKASS